MMTVRQRSTLKITENNHLENCNESIKTIEPSAIFIV